MIRTSTLLLCLLAVSVTASAQQPDGNTSIPSTIQLSATGTAVSSTRTTLVIRSDAGEYRLFELNSGTTRPESIPVGATVAVTWTVPDSLGVGIASFVRVTALPTQGLQPQPAALQEPVPAGVRSLESNLKRQTSRYRLGIRSGVALDPELVMLGAQGMLGPFFGDHFWARPNLEVGFGEVTDLIGLNFDALYRVPVTAREGKWSMFFGAGPSMNFVKLGFSPENPNPDEDFSFDDFKLDMGLNILAGVQSREGLFLELKSTVYAQPGMRFVLGYSF